MKVQLVLHRHPIHWKPVVFPIICVLTFGLFSSVGSARIGQLLNRSASWAYDQVNKGEGYKFADFGKNNTILNVHPYSSKPNTVAGVVISNRKVLVRLDEAALLPVIIPAVAATPELAAVVETANSETNSINRKFSELISSGASVDELKAEFSTYPEFANAVQQAKNYGLTRTSLPSVLSYYQSSINPKGL